LGARPNRLALEVELADPLAAARIRYRWRFVGEAWSEWQARGTVVAANLPPGSHQLEIEALDRRGLVTPPLVLAVEAAASWYERTVVRLLLVALFGLAMVGVVRWRTARVEAERRRLEQAVADRTLELAEANVRLEEASLTDPLTGLRNRRFLEPLADTLEPTTTRGGERLLVVVADLDHFKSVNDRFGHTTGDQVLAQAARVFERASRASAVVARWGGEEFVVLERLAVGDDPAVLVERFRAALDQEPSVVPTTASFGWCTTPLAGAGSIGWRLALQLADHALYVAKAEGRNRCRGVVGRPDGWLELDGVARQRWVSRLGEDPRGAEVAGLLEIVRPEG
jgi:diguanylate cyclase (GGDEF)-like protein